MCGSFNNFHLLLKLANLLSSQFGNARLMQIKSLQGVSKRRGQGKERLCTPGLGGGGQGPGTGECEPSEIMYVVCNCKGVSRRRGQGPGPGPGPGDCEPSETGLSRVLGAGPPPATPATQQPYSHISVRHNLSNITFYLIPRTYSKCEA